MRMILKGLGTLEIEETSSVKQQPVPQGYSQFQVLCCAICRTDAKMWEQGHRDLVFPRVLGHEMVVSDKNGNRYVVWPGKSCGLCRYCRNGRENLCEDMKITGFHHDGELDDIQDAFMRIARSRLSANSICQKGCVAALNGPQDHIREVNKKLKQRRDFSYKRLNEISGITTQKPEGAFYIFPKIEAMNQGIWKSDKEFVLDLLHDQHVLVVHGSGFCKTYGKNHFRAVILPPMDVLEEAFNNMETFMKKRTK